jgi:hypothetical protein
MTPRLFSTRRSPARIAKRFRFAVALTLWLAAGAASARGGDTAPDWLRAASRETMPPPQKDAVAVILLDEQITTVRSDGEVETLYRRAVKILRPEGRDDFGLVAASFDNDNRLLSLKAWSIPSGGKEYEVKEKDAIETGYSGDDLYSGIRTKILKIPAADPGNVIGYEYVQRHRPYVLEDEWYFQQRVPVRRTRFSLQLPPGWEMKASWMNSKETREKDSGGNSYSWEMENVPGIEIEDDMPPWRSIAGRMEIKYFPSDAALRAKTSGTWNDLAVWYGNLTVSTRVPSPEIKQKVAELTANSKSTIDKIRALTSFMQRQIRYVAIEIGIGGLQPHPASQVFQVKYGDCKDKATLLITMLHEIGVEAYYTVVQTERGIVQPDFPAVTAFNHVIVAIRLPDDVDQGGLFAILHHPKYGKLLFFDPTDPYTPLGYIPYFEQDNYGLLVAPNGGELISMPLLPPPTNRLMRTAELSLSPTGELTGEVNEILWGGPATLDRARLLEAEPAKRAKFFEDFLGRQLSNFHLSSATVGNLELYDQSLVLHYKFAVQDYAKVAGNLLIVRPRVLGLKASGVDLRADRKYPVEFTEATLQSDDFTIKLPPGFVADDLPDPADVKSEYGSYKAKIEVANGALHYQRTYELKEVIVPTKNLPELRSFFRVIVADEHADAVLRKSTP